MTIISAVNFFGSRGLIGYAFASDALVGAIGRGNDLERAHTMKLDEELIDEKSFGGEDHIGLMAGSFGLEHGESHQQNWRAIRKSLDKKFTDLSSGKVYEVKTISNSEARILLARRVQRRIELYVATPLRQGTWKATRIHLSSPALSKKQKSFAWRGPINGEFIQTPLRRRLGYEDAQKSAIGLVIDDEIKKFGNIKGYNLYYLSNTEHGRVDTETGKLVPLL